MELILHFSVHYANIRVFCETTKFLVEFLLHAQAVTVAIFINVRKTPLSDCLPIFFRLPCPPLAKRGSLTHSQALTLSKRARDVTAPPVALNRYAIELAGHQSPRQFFLCGMGPQGDGKKYKFF